MSQVDFTVSSDATGYWAAVDDQDLVIANDKASLDLAPGKHMLVWWAFGSPGNSIDIEVSQAGAVIASTGKRSIPKNQNHAAGWVRFTVS